MKQVEKQVEKRVESTFDGWGLPCATRLGWRERRRSEARWMSAEISAHSDGPAVSSCLLHWRYMILYTIDQSFTKKQDETKFQQDFSIRFLQDFSKSSKNVEKSVNFQRIPRDHMVDPTRSRDFVSFGSVWQVKQQTIEMLWGKQSTALSSTTSCT